MITSADIVAAARECLGARFMHMGRNPALGIDCAGLWIHVGRKVGIVDSSFDVPAYTMNPDGKSLIALCDRFMNRLPKGAPLSAGHGVCVAIDQDPQHLAIIANFVHGGLSIIHACNARGVHRVIETRLRFDRAQKLVAAYSFKGVEA